MDPVTLIVGLFLAAGVWLGWTRWSARTRYPNAVRDQLLEGLGDDYQVISGIVRMREGGLDAIDHVVVSPYGIFVILEVRETGKVFCRINDLEWPVRGGESPGGLHNPVWRNRKRVNALEEEFPESPFVSLVVMVNARMMGDRDPQVVSFGELVPAIRKFREKRLERDQVGEIVARLKAGQ